MERWSSATDEAIPGRLESRCTIGIYLLILSSVKNDIQCIYIYIIVYIYIRKICIYIYM